MMISGDDLCANSDTGGFQVEPHVAVEKAAHITRLPVELNGAILEFTDMGEAQAYSNHLGSTAGRSNLRSVDKMFRDVGRSYGTPLARIVIQCPEEYLPSNVIPVCHFVASGAHPSIRLPAYTAEITLSVRYNGFPSTTKCEDVIVELDHATQHLKYLDLIQHRGLPPFVAGTGVGHSTMSIGHAHFNSHAQRPVWAYRTHDLGAGSIDASVWGTLEDKVEEHQIYEALEKINDWFKPDGKFPKAMLSLPTELWEQAKVKAEERNALLDQQRVQAIKDAIEAVKSQTSTTRSIFVIVTGRALRSRTFRDKLEQTISIWNTSLKFDEKTVESTRVIQGLKFIADNPDRLLIPRASQSLWIRSDLSVATPHVIRRQSQRLPKIKSNFIRVVKKGQTLNGNQTPGLYERNLQEPIPFELTSDRTDNSWQFDLSLKATPARIEDESMDLVLGNRYRYTSTDGSGLIAVDDVRKDLTCVTANSTIYVYLYVVVRRFAVKLFAVHAYDGHKMDKFEHAAIDDVITDDSLSDDWQTDAQVEVKLVTVGQICRVALEEAEGVDIGSTMLLDGCQG